MILASHMLPSKEFIGAKELIARAKKQNAIVVNDLTLNSDRHVNLIHNMFAWYAEKYGVNYISVDWPITRIEGRGFIVISRQNILCGIDSRIHCIER